MKQYHDLLRLVLEQGRRKSDRTGTGTLSVFGAQARFPLRESFPLLTTKKVHFKSVVYELLWFLRGETNVRWLQDHGVSIWNEWADAEGNLGRPSMAQPLRDRRSPDGGSPIRSLASSNKSATSPKDSRRHIVTAWNPAEVDAMALPPCHALFQFFVLDGELSCQLYQRSADLFLGVPFNIASYALLTCMVAQVCDLKPGEFVHTFGDLHLYDNHLDQAREQLSREMRSLPRLTLNPKIRELNDFTYEDITLQRLQPASAHQGAHRGMNF